MQITVKHKYGTETMSLESFCKDNSIKVSAADLDDGEELTVNTFLGETKIQKSKTIGKVITDCVPEKFQHFFARFDEDMNVDNAWWAWNLELDDEDSVGTHVWNLLPLLNETLDWMPDADHEVMWKAAGDQCLTWVYG